MNNQVASQAQKHYYPLNIFQLKCSFSQTQAQLTCLIFKILILQTPNPPYRSLHQLTHPF